MEPPWDGGTGDCKNDPGHMTRMAAMPIHVYGKNLLRIQLTNIVVYSIGLFKYYQICSNDDAGLTLTYFMARSKLVPYAFVWEKGKTMDLSETVVVCDTEVGRCRQLNDYMNLCECQRSRTFIDLGLRLLRFSIFKLLFLRSL